MNKVSYYMGIFIAALALNSASIASEHALWGAAELATAGVAATHALAEEYGEEAVANTTELSLKLRSTKTAARATITYMENEETKTVSFFCHTHGEEIDCH